MATDIVVPKLGESVTEGTVARWLKSVGDSVAADQPLLELETDKVTVEINAPVAGVLSEIKASPGTNVKIGAVVGLIAEGGVGAAKPSSSKPAASASVPTSAPVKPAAKSSTSEALAPSVRKLVEEKNVDPSSVQGTGKDGRLTKGDVLEHLGRGPTVKPSAPVSQPAISSGPRSKAHLEQRVRMTRLRQRIAERLKEAQNTAAILTTFNEVDMSPIQTMRQQYKESFEKKYGVKFGLMSFFVKACIMALKEIPTVNAEIDGTDIVYKNYYDIGVAVGTEQGLVVPVVRNADQLSFAEVEKTIGALGQKAREGKLAIEDLMGGTFTISNGGIYGSLMGTPILNPPQSGILGMHKIQERPVVVNGKIEVRPMMYLALSYDHRIIDGKEAVTFLVRVKEALEEPQRLLLGL